MTNSIQAEVVDIPSNAVALRPSMAVGHAMGVNEIVAQVKLIQDVMHQVMKDGEHYGTIPGCGNKKTLLQPGAQKLTMTFRLAPEYEIQEVNLDRGHKEYRVTCTLKSMGNGSFVGQGVGCCSSMESKYRFRGGARKCPECGKETIIKGKAEYGGGWICFSKKGGCGQKWADGAQEIEGQEIGRIENDNPADVFNTVLKMAKKRAFVDATITATAASDIFTQDIDDEEPENGHKAPVNATTTHSKHSPPTQTPTKPSQAAQAPFPTVDQREKMIKELKAEPGGTNRDLVTEYFRKAGALLPTENIEDLPLTHVPSMESHMRALGSALAAFGNGERAELAFPKHFEPEKKTTKKAPKQEELAVAPASPAPPATASRKWEDFPVPFGKSAGMRLGDVPKNSLFGFWANFEVKTEYNGKPLSKEKIAKDQTFRDMLDAAGEHYEFKKPEEEDSVPF